MKLHEQKDLFREAVTITAQQMNLPEIYIEKDYWVTLALYKIFNSEIAPQVIFKGGTALSKCYTYVKRFSEDIDLVVLNNKDESGNQLKAKLKKITNAVSEIMPEVDMPGITNKMGMIRKTAHSYAKEFDGDYGQIRDIIIVEATWLGYYEPYTTRAIHSFIYEMMVQTGQHKIAEDLGMLPFDVLVLEPKRTMCEKIMSLVRFSHTENPIEDLKKKIRHTYDLYQLLHEKEISYFFDSKAFDEMLLKVANDDVASFKNNNAWLQYHPNEALIFAKPDEVWNEIKGTYNGPFRKLVFGDFPSDEKVLETLLRITERLKKIDWKIEFHSN